MKDAMILPFEIKTIKENTDDGFYHIQGILSVYGNIDYGRDRVKSWRFYRGL